ncbi:hypothetical protein L9F63_003885, partial [Diploptera punctata]
FWIVCKIRFSERVSLSYTLPNVAFISAKRVMIAKLVLCSLYLSLLNYQLYLRAVSDEHGLRRRRGRPT